MKKLLIGLMLVSCGKHTLLTMPEIDLNYDKKSDDSKPAQATVAASRAFICGDRAYKTRCTYVIPTGRILQSKELYDWACYDQYMACLKGAR